MKIKAPIVMNVLSEMEVRTFQYMMTKVPFNRSLVLGNQLNQARTSLSGTLSYDEPICNKLRYAAAAHFNVPVENCEPLHLAKYTKGQEYKPHHDSCCDDTELCRAFKGKSGDRIGTMLVYVTDDFEGGFTEFPHLEFSYKPKAGMAIFWETASCPDWAIHCGTPVINGTKIIATVWVREKKYVP